jgi:hypothetical protein
MADFKSKFQVQKSCKTLKTLTKKIKRKKGYAVIIAAKLIEYN